MYKRFPLNNISNNKQFYLQYISEKNDLLQNIDFIEVDEILIEIKKCIKRSNIIYSCGNGGSSSLADHLTCDFIKQTNNRTNFKLKSISLTSNFSLISAISNDISFDEIFSFQVKKLCKKNDILILFSVSGNSKNLINAVKIAKKKKVKTISFTGFDGGKLSKLSDFNINFPMANYGIVEDCHVTMMHYISQYLRNTAIKSRNFKKINF
jgi:phosphoheptose isomerase